MSVSEIAVNGGPGKDDLLRAVSSLDKEISVIFDASGEVLEAHIDAIDEEGLDGLRFALRGRLQSSNLRGAYFTGVYDAGTRTGQLRLQAAI